MRITDSMVNRNYKNNVRKAQTNFNNALMSATNYRKYQEGSENASAAAKAYKYRRDYNHNLNYMDSVKSAADELDTVETTLSSVLEYTVQAKVETLQGISTGIINDEQRGVLATSIRSKLENIVNDLNTQFAGKYTLGGSSTNAAPFSVDDNGNLLYRGLNVSAAEGTAEYEKLKEMANEKVYVDIGLGIKADKNGNIDDMSALNTAFPGISFLGYGTDSEGNSLNIYQTMKELADSLDAEPYDIDKTAELADRLQTQSDQLLTSITKLGSKTKYLEYTQNRLENIDVNLLEKINDTEYVDPYDAIMDFTEQQLIYNTALKAGSSILQSSLFDFM